ncbi:hypothetical protein GCM10019059_41530 [Camelimonas fluminis]|nr:hypothetical protein GCM10019059_41530 [Camelimonas fluminis]
MTWRLQNGGHGVHQKRIRGLMRLTPIHQRPNTSKLRKGHKTYPYLLGELRVEPEAREHGQPHANLAPSALRPAATSRRSLQGRACSQASFSRQAKSHISRSLAISG